MPRVLKFLLASAALVLAPAAHAQDYVAERVEQAISLLEMRVIVAALGHTVEAEDAKSHSLRAVTGEGTRYVISGTACDIEGVPGCRGIVIQALFEGAGRVTAEKLAAANLNQVAVSTRFDPSTDVVSVTRYLVTDGGVTMANVGNNIEVLLALAPEVLAIVVDPEGTIRPE